MRGRNERKIRLLVNMFQSGPTEKLQGYKMAQLRKREKHKSWQKKMRKVVTTEESKSDSALHTKVDQISMIVFD